MSDLEKNKQIVRDFINALSTGDMPGLMRVLDPGVTFNLPNTGCLGGSLSMQEFGKIGALLGAACPNGVALELVDMTAEDDRVSCRVNGRAKTVDGGDYNNRYHMLLKIRDGKIVETHEYMDTLLVEKTFAHMLKK